VQGGRCYITDLGLCGPVDEKSSNKVYGIASYVAPEVLRGKKNTKESDIYSVGMLMWEIFAGHPPFDDRAHNHRLVFDICAEGLRPPILPEMPDDYVQMMQRCWDVDPSKRPTSSELFGFAHNKRNEIF
jgi:serine/threonine protein kinase